MKDANVSMRWFLMLFVFCVCLMFILFFIEYKAFSNSTNGATIIAIKTEGVDLLGLDSRVDIIYTNMGVYRVGESIGENMETDLVCNIKQGIYTGIVYSVNGYTYFGFFSYFLFFLISIMAGMSIFTKYNLLIPISALSFLLLLRANNYFYF